MFTDIQLLNIASFAVAGRPVPSDLFSPMLVGIDNHEVSTSPL